MTLRKLYTALVAPRSANAEDQSREITLNILLLGTLALAFSALAVVTVNLFFQGHAYNNARFAVCLVVTLFFWSLYMLSRKGHLKIPSYLFVLTYFMIFVGMVLAWGIQIPQGILIAAFVIILSGILLGSKFALYAAILNIGVLLLVQFYSTPNTSWKQSPAESADVLVFGITFGLIAVVCWLFNSQIERSLARAIRSEAALRRQKDLLEIKVEQRTKKLQSVQLEQIQQVYRYAELGLVSTALLHDLANHLSTVSLDIEGLKEENNSHILNRVMRTMRYIDTSVQKTREQLHGEGVDTDFLPGKLLDEVVSLLRYKSQQKNVRLELTDTVSKTARLRGDETRFKQLLTNIIANGIDAYEGLHGDHVTSITAQIEKSRLVVRVTDHGKGIPPGQIAHMFEPFYTTKKQGMGLGLFTAKEIAEKGFGGRVSVASDKKQGTVFTIALPLQRS